jgi:hypothetical protein
MTSAKRNFSVANYPTLATISAPIEGDKAWLEDVNAWFTFDGLSWVRIGPLTGQANLISGTTSQSITFAVALSNTSYIVSAQITNLTDSTPQYQPVTVSSKTTGGFIVQWNDELDTNNYILDWLVSSV